MYPLISPCSPRVVVTMDWGCDAPMGEIGLYMQRVGEPVAFAVYAPIDIMGSQLTFQFDDLLFSKKQGRYEGKLMVGTEIKATLKFEYRDVSSAISVRSV